MWRLYFAKKYCLHRQQLTIFQASLIVQPFFRMFAHVHVVQNCICTSNKYSDKTASLTRLALLFAWGHMKRANDTITTHSNLDRAASGVCQSVHEFLFSLYLHLHQ